jgi:tripartite-type tricarboxylate transporter receptor subunit TctC
VAPAKTPKEAVAQLVDWFQTALLAPEVKSKLTAQALYPKPICGTDFEAHMRRQSDLYTRLIRELNIKTE